MIMLELYFLVAITQFILSLNVLPIRFGVYICVFTFCLVFVLSLVLFVCACRSRWGPCMSHEALPGHSCNLPSFHAKLCSPSATGLGGDCLQVAGHLVVVTVHRAPDFQPLTHFAQVAAIHSIVHAASGVQ